MEDKILNIIFEQIEEDMYKINEESKEYIKRKKDVYFSILKIIEQLEKVYDEISKQKLIKRIEEYIEIFNLENVYYNEKFYKKGFKDGVKFMNEILEI